MDDAIPLNLPFKERIALTRKQRSRDLKARYPDIWDKCIRYAGAVSVNHRLDNAAGAEIEDAMIGFAQEMLERFASMEKCTSDAKAEST